MSKEERTSDATASDIKERSIKKVARTGSWGRVMVYHTESGDLERHKKSSVEKDDSYRKLKLSGRKYISFFVDQETETKLKTDKDELDGNYVFFSKVGLRSLGPLNKILSMLGVLSLKSLYVASPRQFPAS
ncbi:hypothetical protein DM02DRAFT_668072 [Periconia macrospinosa]|uniref:Uncharacterized protein n=1 Tax=Periconia macrospinosa TaxID=97972 RepID=A0A2V1E5F4_9PLEO|nr:hypothetical protein DM02DRAFT_668072 [Periconia macrospinosa]